MRYSVTYERLNNISTNKERLDWILQLFFILNNFNSFIQFYNNIHV